MDITGSPFQTDVFDPSQVRVGAMPQGILGKCFTFERKYLLCCYQYLLAFFSYVIQRLGWCGNRLTTFSSLQTKPILCVIYFVRAKHCLCNFNTLMVSLSCRLIFIVER